MVRLREHARTNKPLLVAVLLLLAAVAYRLVLTPIWTQRIPSGWEFRMNYVGTQTSARPGADTLPVEEVLSDYQRQVTIVSEKRPDSIVVEDRYVRRDIGSGKVVYDFIQTFVIDPRDGSHIRYPGDYFTFPTNVEKTTYRISASYLKGYPLRFLREEKIEHLNTYVFGYNGRGEYTEFYEGWAAGDLSKIPAGQEVRCARDMFRYRAWVEPVTGKVIKSEESCPSGSYAYGKGSGEKLYALDRFAGVTSGNDLVDLIDDARIARLRMLWLGKRAPFILALTGLVVLIGALWPRKSEAQ